MDDKGGDMPGHDKDAHSCSQYEHAHEIDPAQVFRGEKKGIGTEMGGKFSLDR